MEGNRIRLYDKGVVAAKDKKREHSKHYFKWRLKETKKEETGNCTWLLLLALWKRQKIIQIALIGLLQHRRTCTKIVFLCANNVMAFFLSFSLLFEVFAFFFLDVVWCSFFIILCILLLATRRWFLANPLKECLFSFALAGPIFSNSATHGVAYDAKQASKLPLPKKCVFFRFCHKLSRKNRGAISVLRLALAGSRILFGNISTFSQPWGTWKALSFCTYGTVFFCLSTCHVMVA